jgi:sugar transferase (PEP-CTERM system associated)
VHNLAREIRLRKDLPLTVVGAVAENAETTGGLGLPMVGTLDNIAQIIGEVRPSRVIIGLKERRRQLPFNTLLRLRMRGLLIEQASTLYEKLTGKIPVESIHPSALIFADGFRHSRRLRFYERFFGLAAATFALLVAGPVMAIVALAIKLDSRGPVFYRQSRVGHNGEPFDILKFRSMRVDAESGSGPVWASDRDPRVTRVGRLLRLLRLDELPQLINVLYGEMSFIGPRPERPYFVDQLREQIPFYDLRHSVRPGITGWAQVRSRYGASVEDSKEKLEYDLFYIKNVSLSLDLLILFQTVKIVLFGRGAR